MVTDHKKILPEKQTQMVRSIFASISDRYDFLNHLLSFGQDFVWRKKAVRSMHFFSTMKCLDVATGTGDIAFATATAFPHVSVTGIDFSPSMIAIANKKWSRKKNSPSVAFITGDATQLPFPDNSFDTAVIAFGIRNIPDRQKALEEMVRVILPGGRVVVLEMVSQQNRWIQMWYQWYLCHILPTIASFFSPHKKAYRYLGDSILQFPSIQDFHALMQKSGLKIITSESLTMGITQLFVGQKLG
ncbi:MAG: bifunctional demethylmenaquinone methyltransferase/2-methoxy-6-polyprenyl-1,4-benzoquinol methylase UbiE [Caldisericia bacterium]|nr:bifunctional demethylmenaquinone methyltransferase/2-methoxy-6-polyprenyl-1,4-benzoquinol methylase UbiE [Caldisericia bacterium]